MTKTEYKNVGPVPLDLPGGRPLGVGETVELDDDQVRHYLVEDLLTNEVLIGTGKKAEHEADLAERRVSRREAKAKEGEEE